MGKNKQKKFDEMKDFSNVFQCGFRDVQSGSDITKMAGHWNELYFHNDNPITLELGCGHGEYTVGLAQRNPSRNYIGIDIKGSRMWVGAKEALQTGLNNVAFLRTQIELLPNFFSTDEIDEIWITFPDPQMKKATKRLTSTYFMQRYMKVMRNQGVINLKTDSPFLYTYTKAMLETNHLTFTADTDDLYAKGDEEWLDAGGLQTYYERQWLDRGFTIKYLRWLLPSKTDWQEPDIEIEKDTYRSYNRTYSQSNKPAIKD